MSSRSRDGQDLLMFLEEKIMEWELDRGEAKIDLQRKITEIKKTVERIKTTNCGQCGE